MALTLAKNYKDALAVLMELVKFMSMNTSVEAVDRLIEQGHEFKSTMTALIKSVTGVSKEITTCMNKLDCFPNEVSEFKKRIRKVENKKRPREGSRVR